MNKLFFPGQQVNEQIFLITRPHWFILAQKIAVWFILVFVLLLGDNYLGRAVPGLDQSEYAPLVQLVKTMYTMGLVTSLFCIWLLYYLNYQIVTNERVVDVDQKNLLLHSFSEVNLGRIQDVTAEIKGLFGTFLNYGHVYIQTAGETIRFEFDYIPDPHRVAKLILDLYEKLPPAEKRKE